MFWLDENRAHDAQLIAVIRPALEAAGVADRFEIMSPRDATRASLEAITQGGNTIAITGNVLRDYLTDLFPIMELGTSAKMLSIVPLLAGGGLYETGAGGSAPKHVQQFLKEGHLRWDSLGEFLALAVSIEDVADKTGSEQARIVAEALNEANSRYLEENKSPSRKVNEIDNRGSHYYLAMYWAKAMAENEDDVELAAQFKDAAAALEANEDKINAELLAAQGSPVDIRGYYQPDDDLATRAMRPSPTLNAIIDAL